MKQKAKSIRTSRVNLKNLSQEDSKSPLRRSQEVTLKSSKTVKNKRQELGVRGLERRTRDFKILPSKSTFTQKKPATNNLIKSQKLFPKKSPQIYDASKVRKNRSRIKVKNAPIIAKKQTRRRRRIVPKKELQIIIEAQRDSKSKERPLNRSQSSSRKISPNKLNSERKFQSRRDKKKMQKTPTRGRSSPRKIAPAKEKSNRKTPNLSQTKTEQKNVQKTPSRGGSSPRKITPSKEKSEKKTLNLSQSKTENKNVAKTPTRGRSSSRKITPSKEKSERKTPNLSQSNTKQKILTYSKSKENDKLRLVRENNSMTKSARKGLGIKKSNILKNNSSTKSPPINQSQSKIKISKVFKPKDIRGLLKNDREKNIPRKTARKRTQKNESKSSSSTSKKINKSNILSKSVSSDSNKLRISKTPSKSSKKTKRKLRPAVPIKPKISPKKINQVHMGTRSIVDITKNSFDQPMKSNDKLRSPRKLSVNKSLSRSATKSRERSRNKDIKTLKADRTNTELSTISFVKRKFSKEKVIKKEKLPSPSESESEEEKKSISHSANKSRERSRKNEDKTLRPVKKTTEVARAPIAAKRIIPNTKMIKLEKTPTPSESKSENEQESSVSEEKNLKKIKPLIVRRIVKPIPKKIKSESESKSEELSEKEKSRSRTTSAIKADKPNSKPKTIKKQVKHELGYKVDTKGMSEEIAKILTKIQEKKKKKLEEIKEEKGKKIIREKRLPLIKKASAADYGGNLTKNPNIKVEHIVRIFDLAEKSSFTHTDVLLAILEIAYNSEYYNVTFRNNSSFFWNDIMQYKEFQKIFNGFKSETLRKYWRYLNSITDVVKIADLVKKHKKFLDDFNIKLLSIIYTIRGFFSGIITDFEESIKNQKVDVRKQEVFETEEVESITGERKKIKVIKITTKQRNKFEESKRREFKGVNYTGPVDEVFGNIPNDFGSNHYNFVKQLEGEESQKFNYLKSLSEEEKKQILSINEEDKLIFKIINNVVNGLQTEFPHYLKRYIIDILYKNAFNIDCTYNFLKDPVKNGNFIFTELDDEIIKTMKNSPEYETLINCKGLNRVLHREDFLMG